MFVVNGIGLAFYTLMIVSFSLLVGDTLNYDDDRVQSVMDTLDNTVIGFTITTFVIGAVCTMTALYGAFKFNQVATCVGGCWFLFEAIRSLFLRDIIGAVIALAFGYPHAVFYYELKNGVMSPSNYPDQKVW